MPSYRNTDLVVKEMRPDEIHMVEQVDRSEVVEAEYLAMPSPDGMSLTLRRVEKTPPQETGPWSRKGVEQRIAEWRPQIENGGLLLGAFRGQRLVGFAALGPKLADASAELLGLFIDAGQRRQGIGSLLMSQTERLARQRGVQAIFLSSNRTCSAVEFYLKHGCKAITLRNRFVVKHWKADPVFAKEL